MTTQKRYRARSRHFRFVDCGHRHRTRAAAQRCADRQNAGIRSQGGIPGWHVVEVD